MYKLGTSTKCKQTACIVSIHQLESRLKFNTVRLTYLYYDNQTAKNCTLQNYGSFFNTKFTR